jgi:tetratricopeptide (TPR) repeat protein
MVTRNVTVDPKELAVCIFLFCAILLVFGQTVRHDFINLDDDDYVYTNSNISPGLTLSGIEWAFTDGSHSTWIPLTWISLMIDVDFYELHAGGFHLTNVLLHIATAMVLFLVLRRMTDRFWPSVFVAAFFAVHPLRVESVTWITERKDVLSGLFFMLTLWAYVGYVQYRCSFARYGLVMVLFALGLLAKPMLVTLPVILLLLDYWPLGRFASSEKIWGKQDTCSCGPTPLETQNGETRVALSATGKETAAGQDWKTWWARFGMLFAEKIPLFAVAVLDSLITILVQKTNLVMTERLPLFWRLSQAIVAYVVYIKKLLYPVGLAIVYPRDETDLSLWLVLAAACLLVGITAVFFLGRRKHPYLMIGWLWYLCMLMPVIGILQFGVAMVADRFTYLPHIGLLIALVWGIADLCGDRPRRCWACGIAASVVLAVLMGYACWQTSFWRDSETLWTHTLEYAPKNYVASNNLGIYLSEEGRYEEAIAQFRKALELTPTRAKSHCNLGNALHLSGRANEAFVCFLNALQFDPDYAEAHNQLGILLMDSGRFDKAIKEFESSLRINNNVAETHYDLGKALLASGQADQAKEHFRKGKELDPNYAIGHNNLGMIHASRGRILEARENFLRALGADPSFTEARINLAQLLENNGYPKDSMAQYQVILKMEPHNAEAQEGISRLQAKLNANQQPTP